MFKKICALTVVFLAVGALSADAKKLGLSAKKTELPSTTTSQFTLGLVQSSIQPGMSQADVVSILGSPNIATRDSEGKDAWVYDKIYTEKSSLDHGAGATIIVAGWGRNSSRSVQAQKTITVVVKFDKNQLVESYTYHSSQF